MSTRLRVLHQSQGATFTGPQQIHAYLEGNQVNCFYLMTNKTFRNEANCFCAYRYLYADLYAGSIWAGTETPEDSGNFTTTKVPVSCALDSPILCSAEAGSSVPALGFIFSFGQDNRKDMFILASTGVYRVARPSRCNYTCSKENATSFAHPDSVPSPSPFASSTTKLNNPLLELLLLLCSLLLLFAI